MDADSCHSDLESVNKGAQARGDSAVRCIVDVGLYAQLIILQYHLQYTELILEVYWHLSAHHNYSNIVAVMF